MEFASDQVVSFELFLFGKLLLLWFFGEGSDILAVIMLSFMMLF